MEQVITPDKEKVTKLGIKLSITFVICMVIFFSVMFVTLFFIEASSLASKHSISLMEASDALFQALQENKNIYFTPLTLIGAAGLLLTAIAPIFTFKSALKNGKFQVVLNSKGIISQVGSIKKFITWDDFVQVESTRIPGKIWLSGGKSGKVFILDVFDFNELNLQINNFRNTQL